MAAAKASAKAGQAKVPVVPVADAESHTAAESAYSTGLAVVDLAGLEARLAASVAGMAPAPVGVGNAEEADSVDTGVPISAVQER